MVEITSEEQSKVKTMKRTEDSLRDILDNIKHKHESYTGPRRRRREKERYEKILKRLKLKTSPILKGNSQSSSRGRKSPIQEKHKEKHAKTHTNQTKTKHKERMLKRAREKQVMYKGNPIHLTADLSAEHLQARRE